MITPTTITRSLVAIAILSCTIRAPATAARHNTRTDRPTHIKSRINPKDGAVMVYVPAGQFLMGSKKGEGDDSEHPQHKVYLDAYWIYKNDVTVAQYRKFCKATGRKMPDAPPRGWKHNHPVVNVTWDDAKAYCDWAGVALPTEAQWEKATRGADGRTFPWGNTWVPGKLQCSKIEPGDAGGTAPVGSYPGGVSPYGCLDMEGNAWQWCADWYDKSYYARSPARNPAGPATGRWRVARGGSWFLRDASVFRRALRNFDQPDGRYNDFGFRCALRAGG